jgi:endonuclease YncB( thermonuclease family)
VLDRDKRQHKIRLSGIDAPEKGQAFGDWSRQNLAELVHDQLVEAHCRRRDRYDREVCKVIRGACPADVDRFWAVDCRDDVRHRK